MSNNDQAAKLAAEQAAEEAVKLAAEQAATKGAYLLEHKSGRKVKIRDAIQAAPFVRAGYKHKGKNPPDWLKELLDAKDNAGTI